MMKNLKNLLYQKEKSNKRKSNFLYLTSMALFMSFGGLVTQAAEIDNVNVSVGSVYQKGNTIRGVVKDESGEPMIGVSVLLKGTSIGTITDVDGNFTIKELPNGPKTLEVSYIGYITQSIKLSNQKSLTITLKEDSKALDEIVVVGYGSVKKSDLTGSVGSVNSNTITSKGSTSIMESLQGQVAGVNITQSSSRAGDGFNIQIRGKSSMNDDSKPLYVIDGVVCDNMDFLNPMDIEKVDILKDASSTAIYGSRATNGVVMITTKKGETQASKATISYDGYYGYKTTANMPDFMDGDEFMKYRFSRYLVCSQDASTGLSTWNMSEANFRNLWGAGSDVIKQMYLDKNYTYWPDEVTRDGSQQNHFINVTGNAKDISYRIGLGYQNEEGVLYDDYERWNLKGAVDHKISDVFSAGISANLAKSEKKYGSQNSIKNGFLMTPVMTPRYWEGENAGELIYQPGKDAVLYPSGGGPSSTINPIVDRNNSKDNTNAYNAMANIYFQITPIKDLIIKTTFSPMYEKSKHGVFYGSQTQQRQGKGNEARSYNDEDFSYTWDTQANYMKNFGNHNINALALVSVYQDKQEGDYMKVTNMPFDVDWNNMGSGIIEDRSSYYSKISMLSYVARLNYSYLGRYLLTVSSRWDGSSKFTEGNRWGMFPSAALAWRINEEKFMSSTDKWLSNLKLRFSVGVTGNNAGIQAYSTQSLANREYYYNFGKTIANGYGYNMSNSSLSWEKTTEFNLGLDFGLFDNRINGTIDLYNKNSKDLLMNMETPLEMGSATGSIVCNVGKVNNKGLELQLNGNILKTKDLNWTVNLSYARNINTIKELNGEKKDLVGNKWFIGQPIDVVYGYKYLGVCTREQAEAFAKDPNQKTKIYEGEMIPYDKTGDGVINANDKMILGHCSPTWTGSLASNLSYKNIDFSFNIYTSQGGTVYSPFMDQYTQYSSRGTQHLKIDYYIPQGAPVLGDNAEIASQQQTKYGSYPFPTNTNGSGGGATWSSTGKDASQYFVDNSYVKVKNITLGYTFPKSLISHLHLSNLRIYANVINPFTFTDYKGFDPEWAGSSISDGSGGVSSRTYQIGVNLKF